VCVCVCVCVSHAQQRSVPGGMVGALAGHMAGITCVSARGDGRQLLSNGKDHCAKLWDLRMLMPTLEARDVAGYVCVCDRVGVFHRMR
jgi:WD40 repeat protein